MFLVATQCLLWYSMYSIYSSIKETCRYLGTSGGWFYVFAHGCPSRSHQAVHLEAMKNNVFACILAAAHFDSQDVQCLGELQLT